jgi:peptidoglycan/xylan/chitin deacetylase (PgdA/CDA1 family)
MSPTVCVTVDVEDFYEGMAVLGHEISPPAGAASGLEQLLSRLERQPDARITLFVVGDYAPKVREALVALVGAGHEIASHGPDHGRLPGTRLVEWLRRGREGLEDMLQVRVSGFRSPRFDVPGDDLSRYREQVAQAGYEYVSDASHLGRTSPVGELPVLTWRGLRIGGGSYQRLMPTRAVDAVVAAVEGPAVVYYHSYDFDPTLPSVRTARSLALVKQLLARDRVERAFDALMSRHGSKSCAEALR